MNAQTAKMPDPIIMSKGHMDNLYNSKNYLVKYVHNARINIICRFIFSLLKQNNQQIKLLDAGCGEGHLLKLLSAKISKQSLYGVDATKEVVDNISPNFSTICFGNITDLEYEDDFFDVVVCTEVLEHITSFDKAISELKRILKSNGYLIITFPNEVNWTISRFLLGRKPIKVPDHFNSFSIASMKRYVHLPLVLKTTIPFNFPQLFSLTNITIFKKC